MCELTINLILGFEASSAAPSEEVWSFGLLHEDHLERTCRGSSRRLSWQNSRAQRRENNDASRLMGLSVCLRSGAQLQSVSPQGSLHQWTRDSGLNLEHKLTSLLSKKKDPSPSKMLIRLTEKCSKYSQESQESRVRPGHFCVVSGLRWRGRERCLPEVGSGVWRNISRRRTDWWHLTNKGSIWGSWINIELVIFFVCCDLSGSLWVHFRLNNILGNVNVQIKNFLKDAKTNIIYFHKEGLMLNSPCLLCRQSSKCYLCLYIKHKTMQPYVC